MPDVSQISVTRQQITATALANAAELVAGVINEISGNDISNAINGECATDDMIQNIALQRMTAQLISRNRA